MRILYLITRAEHGGAQSHLLQLVQAAPGSAEIMVATGEEGPLCASVRALAVQCRVLEHLKHAPSARHDPAAVVEIARLIRAFDPDLVHAHSAKAGLLGRLAATLERVPSVYTAHGFAFAHGAPPARKAMALAGEWIAGRAGDFTITVSQSECRQARRYRVVRPGKTAVIYSGVEESPHRAVPGIEPPIIAMVARFAYPKQQQLLLRAFQRMFAQARLWLIGDGPQLVAARQAAESHRLDRRVVFWGDRADVPELLAKVQIGALISAHEGFGLSLLECMRAGLPVVASNAGGTAEIVVDGKTGILVPPGDEIRLAEALDRLVADPEMRHAMGNAGLARHRAKFSLHAMVEQTFRVYHAILTSSHQTSALGCSVCTFPRLCNPKAISGD